MNSSKEKCSLRLLSKKQKTIMETIECGHLNRILYLQKAIFNFLLTIFYENIFNVFETLREGRRREETGREQEMKGR